MATLAFQQVWIEKNKYSEAERQYFEGLAKLHMFNGFPQNDAAGKTVCSQPITPIDCFCAAPEATLRSETFKSNANKPKKEKNGKRLNNSLKELLFDNSSLEKVSSPEYVDTSPSPFIDKPLRVKEAKEKRNKADKKNQQMKEACLFNVQYEKMYVDNAIVQPQVPVTAWPQVTISPKKSRKSKKDKSKSKSPPKEMKNVVAAGPEEVHAAIVQPVCDNTGIELIPLNLSELEKKCKRKVVANETFKDEVRCDIENKTNVLQLQNVLPAEKGGTPQSLSCQSLASEVAKARQHIKNSLECMDSVAALAGVPNVEVINKLNSLEKTNSDLRSLVEGLQNLVINLQGRVQDLERQKGGPSTPSAPPQPSKPKEDSDDGVDLFASDSEDDQDAAKVREERLAAYAAKKSKKPVLIAKSNIILDVKTWSDEIDMKELEAEVRKVTADGLLWGASKLVPLAFGVHKLQISCVVEDDKVSIDWLQEELEKLEDYVQSVDIAAFNKV